MQNKFCQKYFDAEGQFFIPYQYHYDKYNTSLLMNRYPKYFVDWFYSEYIDITPHSKQLCENFSEHFNIWWDAGGFNWDTCSKYLVLNCIDFIDIWLNHKKFSWKNIDGIKDDNDKLKAERQYYVLHQIMK
jgi:hypothetical protein